MSVFTDFDIELGSREVARLLQCGEKPSEDIIEQVGREISACRPLLKPRATLERLNITQKTGDSVALENGVTFEGEFIARRLAACQSVAVSVCTVGEALEAYSGRCFDEGDYLKGRMIDCIAAAALQCLGSMLWNRLLGSLAGTDIGMTSRLSPGDTGWAIGGQSKLFECLRGNADIGVTLLGSGMMFPVKSASAVYGMGRGIGIARCGHVCSKCALASCAYRAEGRFDVTVEAAGVKTTLSAEDGGNLYKLLVENGLIGSTPCAGGGTCGKCRIKISAGAPAPTPEDERHITPAELESGVRLACRIKIHAPMQLAVESPVSGSGYEILTDGTGRAAEVDPLVRKKHLLPSEFRTDGRPDLQRLSEGLGLEGLSAGPDMLLALCGKLGAERRDFTAVAYGGILTGIESGDTESRQFGVAADIGTTTVVCYLVELAHGGVIDVEARANSQSAHGADVITRIGFTIENEGGTQALKALIVGLLNDMLSCLCQRNGIPAEEIYNMAVTGNTTMIHFLLGLPAKNIAAAPFTPVTTAGVDFRAGEIGLNLNCTVSVMPGIASYAGSDITAGILACGMTETDEYSLLLDLGTNGEMALGSSRGLFVCSVAAGPAFEGGNIQYGVGGVRGAICRVDLAKARACETIGGAPAIGICGSGVLDTVAELLKHGVIDETGRMAPKETANDTAAARLRGEGAARRFLLEENTALGEPVFFTQKDVREVQLAKAAVAAGVRVLLEETGIALENIGRVYLAGGFGNYMSVESALRVGLIPEGLKGRITAAGNSAGEGARNYLLSGACRRKAAQIAGNASYIELSKRVDFQDYFVDAMTFE